MKDNILKYTLIVSLLMNVSLLGAAAYTHYRQVRFSSPPLVGLNNSPGRQGPFGAGFQDNCLFEGLSLKPEQVKLFQQKAVVFHKTLDKKRQEIDRLRDYLLSLMRTDNPDNKTIETTIGQINTIQQDMQKTVVSHMLEFKSMLDKDQQNKFLNMVEEAMRKRAGLQCP